MYNKRREFLKKLSLGGLIITSAKSTLLANNEYLLTREKSQLSPFSSNDQINIAIIGCGIQGFSNAQAALQVEGVKLVAVCDLYSGRLTRMKEVYGDHLYSTKEYKELLVRDDIDAVCICTSDHWHDHMTIESLRAGKAVYCEKPMVHHLEEGHNVIDAEKKYNRPLQIGSQRVSSIGTEKARDLFRSGIIGQLIMADIRYDRASSNGAWQYSIPTDAGPDTVDWDRFIGDSPKIPFDATRFFRWRNYQDYGTGVAGDLFVHLFSALHVVTGSLGPERIYASGGLRFWKDGRDVPDVTLGLYDYPETNNHPAFNVQMRVNFADGSGGGSHVKLIGTEGVMTLSWDGIHVQRSKVSTVPTYGGWDSFATFSKQQQKDFEKWYKEHYGSQRGEMNSPKELKYTYPEDYNDHVDHWAYFADSIRNGTALVEDGSFGLRAAGPALATNNSYYEKRIINWDSEKMKIV